MMKIKTEINEMEMEKIQMINKIKRLFFQKISKMDKPLAKLAKINIQIKKLELKRETL